MIRPDPTKTIEQQSDEVLARMCLWAEARGESPTGMLAIRYVIGNRRAESKGKKTTGQIILAPKQFSSFNLGDPNRVLLIKAPSLDSRGWAWADAVCELYDRVLTVDPTHGALNYYAHDTVTPRWGVGHPKWVTTAIYGRHTFGRAG